MPKQPNILCFVTDQQRADHLGCAGNSDLKTPHIDRLASEGMMFNQSYVANPVCMPNRASLFTGMYPSAHGLRENGIPLDPNIPVLPEIMRQHGYTTASFGKLHLQPYGGDLDWEQSERLESRVSWESGDITTLPKPYYGFEETYFTGRHGPGIFGDYTIDVGQAVANLLKKEYAAEPPTGAKESWKSAIPADQHYNSRIADATIAFLDAYESDQPFFVWCSFPDPHHPYCPPLPYANMYDPESIAFDPARRKEELDDLPAYFSVARAGKARMAGLQDGAPSDDAEYREIIAHTYGMISHVDHNVGRVMQALETNGHLDNTIVVYLSDHGDLMGDHWLINKGPFLFDGLVRVPTIWRLPGQNKPASPSTMVSAIDFCPTVLDLAGIAIPDSVQGKSYAPVLRGELVEFRDNIYIEFDDTYLDDRLRQIRTPHYVLTQYGHMDAGILYDLDEDPRELRNLWDYPAYTDQRTLLQQQLLRIMMQNMCWLPAKRCHA